MDRRIYGYVRISTPKQNIDRQVRNIKKIYPDAIIIKEIYTGSTLDRPEWKRVIPKIPVGSLIVFDSVSRMARNADEGVADYFELFDRGIELEFLVEHYIDTAVYRENIKDKIALMGTDEDEIIKGINNYFRKIAEKQIRIAFEQAEKELDDLHQRTREGIETARLAGKQIGQLQGRKLNVKKLLRRKKLLNYTVGNMEDLFGIRKCRSWLAYPEIRYISTKRSSGRNFNKISNNPEQKPENKWLRRSRKGMKK